MEKQFPKAPEPEHIPDPQIPDNASCIVILEKDGAVNAAIFHGREIKKNSIPYSMVEQLLSAVLGVSQHATLIEDTTDSVQAHSIVADEV